MKSAKTNPSSWNWIRENATFLILLCLTLFVRILFWTYTNRTFEDALITLTPVRNWWLGNGLTHHISEPQIHSFTSPISILIPLPWEKFGLGLFSLKITSLFASAGTSILAYQILKRYCTYPVFSSFFPLCFLAFDYNHVFFGMAGMETSAATLILVFSMYCLLTESIGLYALSLPLTLLARPEFLLWFCIGIATLIVYLSNNLYPSKRIFLNLGLGFIPVVSWLLFAYFQFGSPIPNTILAKSLYPREYSIRNSLSGIFHMWKRFSPYFSNYFVSDSPIHPFLSFLATAILFVFAFIGSLYLCKKRVIFFGPTLYLAAFVFYLAHASVSPYFMWYIPPATGIAIIYAGIGIDRVFQIAKENPTFKLFIISIVALLAVSYSSHPLYSFKIERIVQHEIEDGVRARVGLYMTDNFKDSSTTVLEPLGYIGYHAFNKTIYDYPGLASTKSTNALKKIPSNERSLSSLVVHLQPSNIVLRPNELAALCKTNQQVCSEYSIKKKFISSSNEISLEDGNQFAFITNGPLTYFNGDHTFLILEKKSHS